MSEIASLAESCCILSSVSRRFRREALDLIETLFKSERSLKEEVILLRVSLTLKAAEVDNLRRILGGFAKNERVFCDPHFEGPRGRLFKLVREALEKGEGAS